MVQELLCLEVRGNLFCFEPLDIPPACSGVALDTSDNIQGTTKPLYGKDSKNNEELEVECKTRNVSETVLYFYVKSNLIWVIHHMINKADFTLKVGISLFS